LQVVEFSIFLLNLEWALQQCNATALPMIEDDFHNILSSGERFIRSSPFLEGDAHQICQENY